MDDSVLISTFLPIALAVIMFGLGLSLTVDDFRRTARTPRAVVVALALQILVLPVLAFGLILLFDLPPLLAVGVMLLAASPGGTTANLFSHLFRGDVALNITLTAVNSVLAAVTIPVITNFAIAYFDADGELGLQFGKIAQVIAIVLIPVAFGMRAQSLAGVCRTCGSTGTDLLHRHLGVGGGRRPHRRAIQRCRLPRTGRIGDGVVLPRKPRHRLRCCATAEDG